MQHPANAAEAPMQETRLSESDVRSNDCIKAKGRQSSFKGSELEKILKKYSAEYVASIDHDRMRLLKFRVIDEMNALQPPGRFLRRDGESLVLMQEEERLKSIGNWFRYLTKLSSGVVPPATSPVDGTTDVLTTQYDTAVQDAADGLVSLSNLSPTQLGR